MMKGLKYGAPRWLVEALGGEWRNGNLYDLREHKDAGFDHVRTYRGRVAISQTYEANGGQLGKTLVKLTAQGIQLRIWGISPYYPGSTFSLVLWRVEDQVVAREVMNKMHAPFERLPEQRTTAGPWT
jgi:hypothetical protein